ncbi:MAG: hypothetical protein GOMPHAMPRED_005767 [Gomphillus americanus]|uniref:RRM domain-containing protein n=1 Tax=Gomphillus americanus TaxID=1940652 RepID=A0A8H3FUD2_9LECA|nr:MAG: hypothetical protein GOMPHAMPRED_005767 [Gomphillus americanus]
MAESTPTSTGLPPPPSASAAPGTSTNGAVHMQPSSLPPVVIPQGMDLIANAMGSPYPGLPEGFLPPTTPGGGVRRAAPEPNKRALYIGGLDQRVTEEVLSQIFETAGHVISVKIIPDKNFQNKGLNYGFIEYDDPASADRAMANLNGRRVHQSEIKVNWAYQSSNNSKEDTSNHFHIFVGDLSNEVNDEVLYQAFSAFGSISEARVMWDMKTGRSRGYGFVAFRDRDHAEKALSSMDGEWLGSRAIRCNWANQKGQPSISQQQAMAAMGMSPATSFSGHHQFPAQGIQSYDMIINQTPSWQTTCYVGNLTPYTTQADIVPLFQNFGYVVETRFTSDRGFAFIKMDSHENAAMAICQLSGYQVNGRPLKCSWGKDRPATGQFDAPFTPSSQTNTPFSAASPAFGNFPQYTGGPMSPGAGPMQGYPSNQAGPSYGNQAIPGSAGVAGYGQGQGHSGYVQSPTGNGAGRGFGGPEYQGGYQQQGYGQAPGNTGGYGQHQNSGAGWTGGQRVGGQPGTSGNGHQYGPY